MQGRPRLIAAEELSNLIGSIYDAGMGRERWPVVLQRTCAFIGGCAAALISQDFASRSGRFYFSWGDDPKYTELFFSTYVKISPLVPHLMMTEVDGCYAASRLMPYEELAASRFFREWCAPQGYTDLVAANLDKTATSMATISVSRNLQQGLMDDEAIHRMELLAPHFRRGVLVNRVLESHDLRAGLTAKTLDSLAGAVFLVDGNARIAYANRRGEAMLAERDALVTSVPSTLTLFDAAANQALRVVIADARGGDSSVAVRGIAVPHMSRSGEKMVTHLMPLTSGARQDGGQPAEAVAAIFIHPAALDLPLPIEAVTRQYKLTPSEMRVLYGVMEAGDSRGIAAMLGISDETVKSHLAHIFAKTGAATRADLVKLVAALAGPLIH